MSFIHECDVSFIPDVFRSKMECFIYFQYISLFKTPIHFACQFASLQIVEHLISHSALVANRQEEIYQ
jgi:hypothetical protein